MDQDPDIKKSPRDNMLTIALVLLVGGMMLFFLWLISLGVVGNVIAGGIIFVVICALHYLVWGKAFSQEVEMERDALKRQDKKRPIRESAVAAPPPMVTLVEEKSDAIQDRGRGQSIEEHNP